MTPDNTMPGYGALPIHQQSVHHDGMVVTQVHDVRDYELNSTERRRWLSVRAAIDAAGGKKIPVEDVLDDARAIDQFISGAQA